MSMTVDQGIVTPEAVVLELNAAGVGSRLLAKLIDVAIQAVIFGLSAWAVSIVGIASIASGSDGAVALVLAYLLVFSVIFVLPAACEILWRGRTPGKALLGIRIVMMDGSPVTVLATVTRSVCFVVDVAFGLIVAVCSNRSRRFGDLVAGTFALTERNGGTAGRPLVFLPPPGLEPYVATLDVGRMTDEEYVLARSVLIRVTELSDDARYHLCLRMADLLSSRFGLPRPEWLVPEPYLICLASAYQQRTGTFQTALAELRMGQPGPGVPPGRAPLPPVGSR